MLLKLYREVLLFSIGAVYGLQECFYKIQDGKIEKSPANIQFVIDNNRLILPVDVDKDKYEYAVDRFMEKAFASNPDERTFFYYSDDQQTILCKTESRIIKDEIEKRQNKS